jgi:hypothetical protein
VKSWWRAVISYPATWVAAGVLALTTWALVAWLDPPGLFVIVLVGLVVGAAITWPLTMSATGTLAKLQFAIPRVQDVDPHELATLATELAALEDPQPAEQLDALRHKRETLTKVLERRLDQGEMTYARYLATAQQVYRSAVDNLGEVAVAYQSLSTMDDAYIGRRLDELTVDISDIDAAERERSTLERRRELGSTQRRKIARLLAQNEAALTALDRTTTALADVPIGKRPEDTDAAMQALEELADRAGKYAT